MLLILIVVFNMVIAVIIDGFEEAKNIILHQKFDKNLNRAPFVMSRTKFWRNKIWLYINECTLKFRLKKKKKKEKKKKRKKTLKKSKAGGNVEQGGEEGMEKVPNIKVKVHPTASDGAAGSEETKVDEGEQELEGEPKVKSRKRPTLNRAASKKDIMISSLASFHHPQQLKMENLVEHVSTAKDTLRPAYHLKNLFKGHVEKNFRKMYAMSECFRDGTRVVCCCVALFCCCLFVFFFFLFFPSC